MKKLITILVAAGMLLTVSANVKGTLDTRLLLHFDGNDGDTWTDDSSGEDHLITFNGNAQLDTAEKKEGSASLLLDGTGDHLTTPGSPDWNIFASDTDDWTIDFYVRHQGLAPQQYYLSQWPDKSRRWGLYYDGGFGLYSAFETTLDPAGPISDPNWHWIAFCKVANECAIYKDGQQINYATTGTATTTGDGTLFIGSLNGSSCLDGHLDELRITHGNLFNADPKDPGEAGYPDTINIPEPATMVLLGLSALSLIRKRRA